jgi:cysteine desulfuration protein SufE
MKPDKLARFLRRIASAETRADRIQILIDTARRFKEVPDHVATRPYEESHKISGCDSQVYAFPEHLPDGTIRFHFAVENPHGVSAKALAVVLDETLSGAPLEQVAMMQGDVVYEIFGRELSMGKSAGLQGMVAMVAREARKTLEGPAPIRA